MVLRRRYAPEKLEDFLIHVKPNKEIIVRTKLDLLFEHCLVLTYKTFVSTFLRYICWLYLEQYCGIDNEIKIIYETCCNLIIIFYVKQESVRKVEGKYLIGMLKKRKMDWSADNKISRQRNSFMKSYLFTLQHSRRRR